MLEQQAEGGDVSVSVSATGASVEDVKVAEALIVVAPERPRCKYCLQSFATNGTLKIHIRDQHGEKPGELKHIPCLEHGCEFVGRYIDDLIKHLQGRHGRQFTVENRSFQSREEFEAWKKNEENTTHFSYLSISGRHRLAHGDERVYFVCSLSDYFRPRGRRNRRFDSDSRSAYCTSKMVFTITPVGTGFRYAVAYTKEHYGHIGAGESSGTSTRSPVRAPSDAGNPQPSISTSSSFACLASGALSDTERALISLLLERGTSPSAIVDQLRTVSSPNVSASPRIGLATANDVRAALRKELMIAQRALETCADERALLSALADMKRAARTLTSNQPSRSASQDQPEVADSEAKVTQRNGSKRKPRTTKARRIDLLGVTAGADAGSNSQSASAAASSSVTVASATLSSACTSSTNLHLSNLMPPTQIQIGSSAYYGAPYHTHAQAGTINWTDFMNI